MDMYEDGRELGVGQAFFLGECSALNTYTSTLESAADYQPKEFSKETEQTCHRLWELYIALKVTGDYRNVASYKSVRPI